MGRPRLKFAAVPAALALGVAMAQAQANADYKFDQAKAWSQLKWQCDLGPRYPGTDSQIKCRDQIKAEVAKWCDNTRLAEFTHTWSVNGKELHMWNVIGDQNWAAAKVHVVLLAHWDTRPTADNDPDPANRKSPILGANDGASGVAVMLELMRVLKTELNPEVGIEYLFVDGEDLGPGDDEMYLGAVDYANHLPTPKPDYGILLDMIGTKGVRIAVEPQGYELARPLVRSFYTYANSHGFAKTFPAEMGPGVIDDHLKLISAGVPTMDLIDFEHLDHWHTLTDLPQFCSPDSLGQVGKMLEAWFTKKPAFSYPKSGN